MDTTNIKTETMSVKSKINVRTLVGTGMLSAVAFILMYLEIVVPFMPSFIKFDFSDLPGLIGAFAYGPVAGVLICLIKNILHLAVSQSMFVGELSNFILGAVFTATAGIIYAGKKTKTRALIGGLAGSVVMGIFSILSNYFVVYPVYITFMSMSEEMIIGAYQAILSQVSSHEMKGLMECLLIFNLPFTVLKGFISVGISMLIYKPLSRILKANN